MIKAVIFDMDGLMVNSEPIQSKAFEFVIRQYGKIPIFNANGMIQTVGITAKDSWVRLKKALGIEADLDTLVREKEEAYQKLIKTDLQPQEGLIPLVELLKEKGLKRAIASNAPLNTIILVLESLKLSQDFGVIVSGTTVPKGKPHPDIFLQAAKQLEVRPEDCLVLEDAESGVEAGKRAGMKVIAVPNQYTRSHDFSKADLIANSLADIKWSTILKV
jgi:HAD superfamily hydrolase (TIGR01509 family)